MDFPIMGIDMIITSTINQYKIIGKQREILHTGIICSQVHQEKKKKYKFFLLNSKFMI
jgi:hypothetical protein